MIIIIMQHVKTESPICFSLILSHNLVTVTTLQHQQKEHTDTRKKLESHDLGHVMGRT